MRYAQINLALYAQLRDRGMAEADLATVADAYDLAVRLFASRFRPCGRPFVTHLVGTASVVAGHGGDLDAILAALLHAAYEQGEFGDRERGASEGHRGLLRKSLGPAAEELVAAYHAEPWPPADLAATLERAASGRLERKERAVLMLRVANEADDCRDLAPLYYGPTKRASVLRGLGSAVAIASALGEDPLAAELAALQRELDSNRAEAGPRARRDASYTVESVRLRERLLRVLRWRLSGRGRVQ